jgi:hypothetical protein
VRRFEPHAARASITIAGLNDAAALRFDALWIVGLSAQRWPPAPRPHPMLPIAWQRERGVPGASSARELAFAQHMTARLAASAPTVVMSSPAAIEDYASAPSSLLDPSWPLLAHVDSALPTVDTIAAVRATECVADDRAPPYAGGKAPGGAGTIASQSTCPFQAMARRRPVGRALARWIRGAELCGAWPARPRDDGGVLAGRSLARGIDGARRARARGTRRQRRASRARHDSSRNAGASCRR